MKRRKFSHHLPPRSAHNATQAVRARLGLTQDELAYLLDVSRTAVAMDECGTRFLPWPQGKLLLALQTALPAALPPPEPPVLTEADRDDLSFRRQGLQVAAHPLQQKLERVEVRLAQARCWQQVLPQLRSAFPADNTHAHEWLNVFERRAAGILRTEAGAPALLQVRLAAIASEIADITRLLNDAEDSQPA